METYIFIPFEEEVASRKGLNNKEKSLKELARLWRENAATQFASPEDRKQGKIPQIIYYNPNNTQMLSSLENKNPDDYKIYIFAHGQYYDNSITNSRTMGNVGVEKITPKVISERLAKSGLPKNIKNLNLFLCNSGVVNSAGTSIAQKVSQELSQLNFDEVSVKGYYQPLRPDLKDKHKQYYNPETKETGRPSSVSVVFKSGVEQNSLRLGCGLLKVTTAPDNLNFSAIQDLIGTNNAILLIEDKLYYADYRKKQLSQIRDDNTQDYINIKNACKSDYQYASDKLLSSINQLTGKIHLTPSESLENRIISAPQTITQIKSYDDAFKVLNIIPPIEPSIEVMGKQKNPDPLLRMIKKSYYQLSQKYHPDKIGDNEQSRLINEAYELLEKVFAPSVLLKTINTTDFRLPSVMLGNSSEKVKNLILTNTNFNIGKKKSELDSIADKIILFHAQGKESSLLIKDYQKTLEELRQLEKEIAPEKLNNIRDEKGNTDAHLAAKTGDVAAIQKIKANGGDLDILNFEGDTALHIAVKNKDIKMIEELAKQEANFNKRDSRNQTVLQKIILNNNQLTKFENIVCTLIKGGADLQPALADLMIRHLNPLDKIKLLKNWGGTFDFTNQEIQQSLIILLSNNNLERIKAIKEIAGDTFVLSDSIYTQSVCNAINNGHVKMVALCQESGFVFDLSNPRIKETIKQALQNEDPDILEVLKQGRFKFTSNDFSKDDTEFLGLAIMNENLDLLQTLKETGIDLNHAQEASGVSNLTPLISSILFNKNKITQALLEWEVNTDPIKVNLKEMDLETFANAITTQVDEGSRAHIKQAILDFGEKNKQADNTLLISPSELAELMQSHTLREEKSIESTKTYREQLSLGRGEDASQLTLKPQ